MIESERPIHDRDDDRIRERVDRNGRPPRLPKDVRIEDTGNGIRVRITAREIGPLDGTVRFDIHYAANVDGSTQMGVDAALGRAVIVGDMANPGVENALAERTITDGKYRNGWFFVTGVNAAGDRSEPSPPRQVGEATHDSSVPPNVEHFSCSESGEVADKTAYSAVSVSYRAPNPLMGFDAVQLVLVDYPKRGEISVQGKKEYGGLAGGSASFKMLLQVARRPGTGTVSATNGNSVVTFSAAENALIQAQAGDYLEILGVRAQIKSVDSATQVTLGVPGGAAVNWSGQTVAAFPTYVFIGKIRIYARSVSAGGGYQEDLSKLPYADVVLDGELSAPNAPTLAVEAAGGLVRASVTLPAGTEIERAVLYRGTGSGVAFSACTPIKTWPSDQITASATLQYEDTDFTTYEKENAQIFSYYALSVNVRGQQSVPSDRKEATCRLNTGREGSDPPGKLGLKNLLYNAFFNGTSGNQVLANDTSQDAFFNTDGTHFPGRPYGAASGQAVGGGRLLGHTRWESGDGGGGATAPAPKHQNQTEVRISPPGNTKIWYLWAEIDAWQTGAGARANKVKRGGVFNWSVYLRRGAGSQPNGTIGIYIDQYDNNTFTGEAPRRYRDSTTDALGWLTGSAAHLDVSGADLLLDWQRYWGVYRLDTNLTTKQIRVNIGWFNGTQGVVDVCQAMLTEGEEIGVFTADMSDSWLGWPSNPADPPNGIGDGAGRRWLPEIEP